MYLRSFARRRGLRVAGLGWLLSLRPARRVAAAAILSLAAASGAQAFEGVPHQAVYDLALSSGGGNGEISDVSGSMLYAWEDACDGWNVTQRTAMTFTYASGQAVELAWSMTTWEAKDGLRYRFFVRKQENGQVTEEYRGEARLDGPGKRGVVTYTLPAESTVELPAGTVFPTGHGMQLIDRSAAGEKFYWATVFDGSDAAGLFDVNAVVTASYERDAGAGRLPLLAAKPSWRMHLAYFGHDGDAAEPNHEQVIRMHGNGVVESIDLDYGDFIVRGTLQKLEKLDSPC